MALKTFSEWRAQFSVLQQCNFPAWDVMSTPQLGFYCDFHSDAIVLALNQHRIGFLIPSPSEEFVLATRSLLSFRFDSAEVRLLSAERELYYRSVVGWYSDFTEVFIPNCDQNIALGC